MIELIIKWLIPFLCGSLVTFCGTLFIRFKAIKAGMQCLLRAEIIRQYEKWTAKGFCPIYAKEALAKEYKAYHSLGGDDVATGMYNELMELPTEAKK